MQFLLSSCLVKTANITFCIYKPVELNLSSSVRWTPEVLGVTFHFQTMRFIQKWTFNRKAMAVFLKHKWCDMVFSYHYVKSIFWFRNSNIKNLPIYWVRLYLVLWYAHCIRVFCYVWRNQAKEKNKEKFYKKKPHIQFTHNYNMSILSIY